MPKIQVAHLDSLDEFGTFSQATAAVIILELGDLIALETEDEEEKKILRKAHDKLVTAGSLPASIWAILKEMRSSLPENVGSQLLSLPDPSPTPSYMSDEGSENAEIPAARNTRRNTRQASLELDNGVKHAIQLMPPILALCERAMQGASVRAEIEEGCDDRKGENRAYWAEVKKENERWAAEKASMGVDGEEDEDSTSSSDGNGTTGDAKGKEKPKSKVVGGKLKVKDVSGYKTALAAHKSNLAHIENVHLLELQGQAPRFGPLGRDNQGRVYYACSAHRSRSKRVKLRAPDKEARKDMSKWGWFLAVWGPGSPSAREQKGEGWWGFTEPDDIHQLAKWLSYVEELDSKNEPALDNQTAMSSPVKRKLKDDNLSGLNEGPSTRSQVKALVKGLKEYADLLAWRIAA